MSSLPHEQPVRVVIVDDTPDLRELLRMALEGAEFEVVAEAGNGRDGVAVVELHQPDVVLLDLAMPVMDGLEALPLMRRVCPDARIAVLSGFDADHLTQRALDAGAHGYLQKGAPLRTVLEYVRSLRPETAAVPAHLTLAPAPGTDVDPRLPRPAAGGEPPDWPPDGVPATAEPGSALALAPFGMVELLDEPELRLVAANPAATTLLGTALPPGSRLDELAPALAGMVAFHHHRDGATFAVEAAGPTLTGTVRRGDGRLLVFLQPADETATRLRRAIATAAHEIRTPVTVIYGAAETLLSDRMDELRRDRMLASMARQVRVLDTITADLLTAAQIHHGTLRVQVEPVHLRSVLEQVLSDRFDADLVIAGDPVVRADPVRLEQMLTNLLSNAQKYGEPPVVVRVRESPDRICIDVEDHGEGVPEGFRDQLFHEFSRASETSAKGTGLGLYVVRTLAEAHGGSIEYRPGERGGSVFTICLPPG